MLMQAAVYERYGSPDVIHVRQVQLPQPDHHQVRIAIRATTVTAACTMMRRGDTAMARVLLGLTRPRRRFQVMGIEVAGIVDSVGRGVSCFKAGDRVFGFTGFSAGGYAQYVCVPETASLAHTPDSVADDAACTLVDGPTTALYFLRDRARVQPNEHVVIVGASGSIGTAAIQIARHLGAEVTAVCSGRNADLVRSLGAHHVVDYAQDDFSAQGERYDVVFDTVGKSAFGTVRRCLKAGGRFAVTVGGPVAYARDAWSRVFGSRKFIFGMSIEKRAALREVSDLVSRGVLKPVIDRRYPLHAVSEAHRYVESGRKRGNVVLTVGAD
jgi:NADPH2:quinone reductase